MIPIHGGISTGGGVEIDTARDRAPGAFSRKVNPGGSTYLVLTQHGQDNGREQSYASYRFRHCVDHAKSFLTMVCLYLHLQLSACDRRHSACVFIQHLHENAKLHEQKAIRRPALQLSVLIS
jgi:hypothetical protein